MIASRQHRRIRMAAAAVMLMLGIAFLAHRTQRLASIRLALHNALNPGRAILLSMTAAESPSHRSAVSDASVAELQNALLTNELQRRQLVIENARLNQELEVRKRLEDANRVVAWDFVDFTTQQAQVLSHDGMSGSLTEAIIDAGESTGLSRSQLVVDSAGMIVDKGVDHGVRPDQKVIFGAAVVGRVDQVSQWVSLIQPVTHKDFSAAVQIAKLTPQGATFGAVGLLQGTGDGLCRLTGIPYTAAVAVGDDVFSADINGIQGPRLYFGRVVEAQFSTAGQWEVVVRPGIDPKHLQTVSVVQPKLNVNRTGRSLRKRGES